MSRKIIKQILTTDESGRVIGSNTERLDDNGRGQLNLTQRRGVTHCPSCNGVIANVEGSRGKCDICRVRDICSNCGSKCQVCSKNLCSRCKKGFVTHSATFTVCATCRIALYQRQIAIDRMLLRKLQLQRQHLRQRERYLMRNLQLQTARLRMNGRLQARKLIEYRRANRIRERNRYLTALLRMGQNGIRHLR